MREKTGDPGLASRLREARKAKGFSQEDLAEKAGLSVDMVRKIERAERYGGLDTHQKLSKALEIPLAFLLGGEEEMPPLLLELPKILTIEDKAKIEKYVAALETQREMEQGGGIPQPAMPGSYNRVTSISHEEHMDQDIFEGLLEEELETTLTKKEVNEFIALLDQLGQAGQNLKNRLQQNG